MELESRALSAPRDGAQPKRKRPQEDTKREIEDTTTVSTSSSNNRVRRKRQSESSSVVVTPQKKKKRRKHGDHTVAVYNLPKNVNCKSFANAVKRKISEIRSVEVEVLTCISLPPVEDKVTVLVTFRNKDEARLVLSLNGTKYAGRTLYAKIFDPKKKDKERKGLIKERHELCFVHFLGQCNHGNSCIYAHTLWGLKLYDDTVLDQTRCIYLNGLPDVVKPQKLVSDVVNRFKENNIDVHVTFFRHRKFKGDALFEFSNPSHATMAPEILDGLWSIVVHPWKPEYQAAFISRDVSDHTHDEQHIILLDGSNHSSHESNKDTHSHYESDNDTNYVRRSSTREEEVQATITKHPSSTANMTWPPVQEQREYTPPTGTKVQQDQTLLDLKAAIIDLREELLQAKTDAVTAKEKANDLNWKYRELTQDHTHSLQKMQALEKDNANLNHQQDQSRIRIQELERRLGGAADQNDMYLKHLKDLRGKVQQLENANRELQRQESVKTASTASCMERKLNLAMSRNERLVKALNEANEKVDKLHNTNFHLRKEKEVMAEELDKSRATKTHRQPTAAEAKVKSEPLT